MLARASETRNPCSTPGGSTHKSTLERLRAARDGLRWLSVLWCSVSLLAVVGMAHGGQEDPRVAKLLDRLAEAKSDSEAQDIEASIWSRWNVAGDEEVDRMMGLGMRALSAGDLARAVRCFSVVTELAPDFAEGWNKRATAYYQMAEYQASIQDVAVVLRLEPRHFAALSGMGLIYTELGADAPALRWFERALEVHPYLQGVRERVELLRRKLARIQT